MDVLNLNSITNHCIRKTILSGNKFPVTNINFFLEYNKITKTVWGEIVIEVWISNFVKIWTSNGNKNECAFTLNIFFQREKLNMQNFVLNI